MRSLSWDYKTLLLYDLFAFRAENKINELLGFTSWLTFGGHN